MKKVLFTIVFTIISTISVIACELCKEKQPDVLKDIAHGVGPQGSMDYVISWVAVIVVMITLILSIWYLARPGHTDRKHSIKYITVDQ